MAKAILTTQDLFSCPVCLDLLKNPVTIPCGHSFCQSCIKDCWDQDDQDGSPSCPQCRQTFTPRPALCKNIILAELADELRKTKLQDSPPADTCVAPGEVECDVCTGRKHKAIKSCLVCLLSFCEAHIQAHYESPAYKKHRLVEASFNLQEIICPHHDKLLEAFCRTDQKLICLRCVDFHNHHQMASAEAERTVKQNTLKNIQKQNTERIQQGENKLNELRQAMVFLKWSAGAAVVESETLFTEVIRSIEKRRPEVKELIRAQEQAELNHIEEVLKEVEQELADLRRREAELEEVANTDDHILFLQGFSSVSAVPGPTDISSINTMPMFSLQFVKRVGTDMIKLANVDLSNLEVVRRSKVHTILPLEPKTREELLKYSRRLTLNPNGVGNGLRLSEGNRRGSCEPCFGSSDCEVKCSEGLSERCYWEFERNGDMSVTLSYDISRNRSGNECLNVFNSWCLNVSDSWSLDVSGSSFYFNGTLLTLKENPKQSSTLCKIGVYLDHKAGILAFYSVSNKMVLLHKVETTFTQPLYPKFRLKTRSSVRICDVR